MVGNEKINLNRYCALYVVSSVKWNKAPESNLFEIYIICKYIKIKMFYLNSATIDRNTAT